MTLVLAQSALQRNVVEKIANQIIQFVVWKKVWVDVGQYWELSTFPFAVLDLFSYSIINSWVEGFFPQLYNTKIHNFAPILIGLSLH